MWTNYLRISLRNFQKNKFFTFINMLGFAIGISAALVIYLIVEHEFSYESFRADRDRIYRVVSKIEFSGTAFWNSGIPLPAAEAFRQEITGIDRATHFYTLSKTDVLIPAPSGEPASYKGQGDIIYADNEYFSMFEYRWLAGSPETALAEPNTVVLAESRARTYFSYQDPQEVLGKHITYEDTVTVTVNGIVKDVEGVTDFNFLEFISLGTVQQPGFTERWDWTEWHNINSASQFFVRLREGIQPKRVEQQLIAIREGHRKNTNKKDDMVHFLQPLSDLHFDSQFSIFVSSDSQGNKSALYGLLAVAAFLLLLGCINFVNLSTAQATRRAKEVGIRKTLGSGRGQLTTQFLAETFILTVCATLLGLALAPLLQYILQDFVPRGVTVSSIYSAHVLVFLSALTVVVSILSGIYPGLVLSRFQPASILRNQLAEHSVSHRAWLRKILTVTQFVITQFMVILTIVVSKQILFSLNKDLGYKKEAIVFFHTPRDFFSPVVDNRRFALLQELRQIPEIANVSLSGAAPASRGASLTSMKVNNGKEVTETMVEIKYADSAYFDLYGLRLITGRSPATSDTVREYVVNETYARFLGLSSEEVLKYTVERGTHHVPIVGVVTDFHAKSTQVPIKPLAFSSELQNSYTFHLALNPDVRSSWSTALSKAETTFKKLYPETEFRANFFDQTVESFYKKEQRMARLLYWASGLSVLISCMGLLGLVIYTTNVRVKEIGIRKVLGASVTQVVSLLSKDFIALVAVAFVVAAPVGWWVTHRWLEDYAYHTSLDWWVFALAGGCAILIALLAVSFQAIKAALANPVEALRYE